MVVCALTLVVDESQNNRRRKRAAVNATSPSFDPHEANFSMAIVTSGCRTYDETTNQWTDNGCQVTYSLHCSIILSKTDKHVKYVSSKTLGFFLDDLLKEIAMI